MGGWFLLPSTTNPCFQVKCCVSKATRSVSVLLTSNKQNVDIKVLKLDGLYSSDIHERLLTWLEANRQMDLTLAIAVKYPVDSFYTAG